MSKALAKRLNVGIWSVWCWRCTKDIGTMTGPILAKALVNTAHKGGLLCPDCRARACRQCGQELRAEQEDKSLCWFCEQEKQQAFEFAVDTVLEVPF